jgi:hypothetical protein
MVAINEKELLEKLDRLEVFHETERLSAQASPHLIITLRIFINTAAFVSGIESFQQSFLCRSSRAWHWRHLRVPLKRINIASNAQDGTRVPGLNRFSSQSAGC